MMNRDDEWPELMTADEVARILRITSGAVRYMLREGQLEGIRIGRRWLIDKREVRRVLDEGKRERVVSAVPLAGGRVHPGRVVDGGQDQDADDRRPVDPDQLSLSLSRKGSGDQARRDPGPKVRIIGG